MYSVSFSLIVYHQYFLRGSHVISLFFWIFLDVCRHVPNNNDFPKTAPEVN